MLPKNFRAITIVENASAEINRGDKIALIGANGKGKSTLLRIIAGAEPFEGERKWGHNVDESFYAQHQLEALNVNNTILDEMKECGSQQTEQELRNLLGCFLFGGDDVDKKIKILSGGEKARVALAKTITSKANFLLLDEPTNHLDIHSVELLIDSLKKYEGTLILVSHDRYFVSKTANTIWEIDDNKIREFKGSYDEWADWKERNLASSKKSAAENKQQADAQKQAPAKKEPAAPPPAPVNQLRHLLIKRQKKNCRNSRSFFSNWKPISAAWAKRKRRYRPHWACLKLIQTRLSLCRQNQIIKKHQMSWISSTKNMKLFLKKSWQLEAGGAA